jgi:hypothetical protein
MAAKRRKKAQNLETGLIYLNHEWTRIYTNDGSAKGESSRGLAAEFFAGFVVLEEDAADEVEAAAGGGEEEEDREARIAEDLETGLDLHQ